MNDSWIPLLPFGFFFAWLFLYAMGRRKVCPDCNRPLPKFQSPFTKTYRQWIEGGYVCQHCGCEADHAGNKVAVGTLPKRSSIVKSIVLLTVALIPALILLAMISNR